MDTETAETSALEVRIRRTDNDRAERFPVALGIGLPDVATSQSPLDSLVSTVIGSVVSQLIKLASAFVNPSSENAFSNVPVRKYFAISCIDFNQDANESP